MMASATPRPVRQLCAAAVAAVLCLAATGAAEPAASTAIAAARSSVSINFGWRWHPESPAHGGNAHGPAVNSTAPPPDAPQAQPGFDDARWPVVDIPHDASVTGRYASTENAGEGFLPLARTWYRKRFVPPLAWEGRVVTLVVDGALSTTTWFLNGKRILVQNPAGYLPTVLTLAVAFGQPNVLACYVDGGLTTGWWYEGSGLIRSARLVATSSAAAVAPFGITSPSYVVGANTPNPGGKTSDGLRAAAAVMSPTALLVGAANSTATAVFSLLDASGKVVATATQAGPNDPGCKPWGNRGCPPKDLRSATLNLTNAQLWSVARPYLYTLEVSVSVSVGGSGGGTVDAVTQSVGIRTLAWDAEQGLKVNEQRVKLRGACNHESFTGVGAALPDRVDLLRVQQLRGVGMNAWRTSHSPPEPVLLDLTDRLGVLVLDENRVLATGQNCQGEGCINVPAYAGDPVSDVGALARRDRNHPSVAWYSLCNEAGCGNGTLLAGDLVERAKEASYARDGSRSVGANIGWISPVSPRTQLSDALDVMGMSHASSENLAAFHAVEPEKPLVMTECCSCQNQRGEDADQPHNRTAVHYDSEVAGCLSEQTRRSDLPEFVAGTFVWTLHDYLGEPGKWPHVSSSFGAIDLAGFQKPPAWFYRAIWLANISTTDAGRPPLPNTASTVRIVESWQKPLAVGAPTRKIHVYTNAPLVSLELNGVAVGTPQAGGDFSAIPAFDVVFAPGTLTAKALAADGTTTLAVHSINSWGAAAAIKLTMDVPSLATGTGTKVFADGMDVALLRAAIVDAEGNPVLDATHNLSFAVSSGPGFIAGVGNGDPSCQEPSQASWRSAYHGLGRAIVRVTIDAAGTAAERALRASVNPDAGKGIASRSSSVMQGPETGAPTSITVVASAPGLSAGSFTIPLSIDPSDAVLAVASASVGMADTGVNE